MLDINNGEVTLVPTKQTEENVLFGGAQGYNNAVYLLNEACMYLYGNSEKGINARSINIDDIEEKMTDEAKNEEDGIYKYDSDHGTYGNQRPVEDNGGKYIDRNRYYPTIYAKEQFSVIDEKTENTGLSKSQQTELIEPTDGEMNGYMVANKSIHPYQSYYYKNNAFMESAFKEVNGINYYDLFMPRGTDTSYWIASRCIENHGSSCEFAIRYVDEGRIDAIDVCYSDTDTNHYSSRLFPIVSLNVRLIEGDATNGFSVK